MIPDDVSDGEDMYCRSCGEVMRARGPFDDGRARHFYHIRDVGGGCAAAARDGEAGLAESEKYQKLKALAVTELRHRFNEYARCGPEIALNVAATETGVDERRMRFWNLRGRTGSLVRA